MLLEHGVTSLGCASLAMVSSVLGWSRAPACLLSPAEPGFWTPPGEQYFPPFTWDASRCSSVNRLGTSLPLGGTASSWPLQLRGVGSQSLVQGTGIEPEPCLCRLGVTCPRMNLELKRCTLQPWGSCASVLEGKGLVGVKAVLFCFGRFNHLHLAPEPRH